jgi:hypothetical protein
VSIFRHDTLGSWTRGGQAIVHNIRMTTQVFYQTCLAGIIIWIGGVIWYALEKSTDYERFVLLKLVQASPPANPTGPALGGCWSRGSLTARSTPLKPTSCMGR